MKNLQLIKRSYKIDLTRINDSYLSDSYYSCVADSLNQARSILYDKARGGGLELKSGDKLSLVNLPVVRNPVGDLYLFEGRCLSFSEISDVLFEKTRISELDSLLNNDSVSYCYIKKGSYYYRENSCGYTSNKLYAGVYIKQEAINIVKSCTSLTLIPIDIERHNSMIDAAIEDLKTRLIK